MALEQEYLLKQEEAEETYQKKLTAGSGININPTTNVISATGGGGSSVTYTSEYPQGETIGILEINDVQNPIQMPELIPGDNVTITQDVTTGALTIDSTGGGNVDDVKIGNTSIVDANKIANIPTMTGATSQAAGSAGVVPAPLAADVDKFLKADGTWDDCSSATELTKAQYDALPSSKESDGVLYMINDIDTTSGTTSDLTRAAYDLLPASKESDDIFYYITDEGIIMHNGVQYAGGGSDVIANPSESATDTLTKLGIDGTVYEIQGGGGGGTEITLIQNAEIYSTTEKQIGVWIDGKPLYKKTIDVTGSFSGEMVIGTLDMSSIDKIIKAEMMGLNETTIWRPIPNTQYHSSADIKAGYFIQTSNGTINLRSGNMTAFSEIVFTMVYTKTTDVAGSGGYQAYGFSPIIYSETEREIGVWRDNKPLYQKTIIIPNQQVSQTMEIDFSQYISDIDLIWADLNHSHIEEIYQSTHYYRNFTEWKGLYDSVDTTKKIRYTGGVNYEAGITFNLVFTVQYTKTTDTAGSGSYNTLGVPTVHYDNNEQVIGTWFGKPLYQKIITITPVVTDTNWHSVNHNIANIEEFIKIEGMAINSTASTYTPIPNYRPSVNVGFCLEANLTIVEYLNNWISSDILKVILQYTKTTD